jgi:Tol biopolymer transport system component
VLSVNGTDVRTLAPDIEMHGAPAWSPDGAWIAVGGHARDGEGLFKVPAAGGPPVRLAHGAAANPVWSPDGALIVYAGPFGLGQVSLFAVRPDGAPANLGPLRARPGGYRFRPGGGSLVYLPRPESLDFWELDLASGRSRAVTRLENRGVLRTFDVSPDGTHIVFDRAEQHSDVVLIERPAPRARD